MRLFLALAAALTGVACLGDKDPYDPGSPLGTFAVTGTLQQSSCGAGAGATATWDFNVGLSRDADTLYWIQGSVPISGQLDAHSNATMTSSSVASAHDAIPQQGLGACSIERDDTLTLALASDAASFTATLGYTFGATSGSDCSDQLTSAGGSFDSLPCTVTYALTATRTSLKNPIISMSVPPKPAVQK